MVFRTAWWTYTAPAAGSATFYGETVEGTVQVKLDVFTGDTLAALVNVGTGTGTAPSAVVPVTSGTVYRVRLGTVADEAATYKPRVTGPVPPVLPTQPVSEFLPWDMPSVSTLRAWSKKSLPHYYPAFPISLHNEADPNTDYYETTYLNPDHPSFRSFGGWIRDRPPKRAARPAGTIDGIAAWRVEDAKNEVRWAIQQGHDGFFHNIMTYPGSGNWQVEVGRALYAAAKYVDPGFKIVPEVDVTGIKQTVPIATIAAYLHEYLSHPSAWVLADGRKLISAFGAEHNPVSWWQQLLSAVQGYGHTTAFMPCLLNLMGYRDAFAPICYGMGEWGDGNPGYNDPYSTTATSRIGRLDAVQAKGLKAMSAVRVQDGRYREGIYDEAENSTNLRFTALIDRTSGAEFMQWPTWQDYTESSHIMPSDKEDFAISDLISYFVRWSKEGAQPPIVRDGLFLSHRKHPHAATPTSPYYTLLMKPRGVPGTGSPGRDMIEVLSFLTAPADITITAGSVVTTYAAPAGLFVKTVPLQVGNVSAVAKRSGVAVPRCTATSAHPVVNRPYAQDMTYYWTNSRR